jgi:hypothetical protein
VFEADRHAKKELKKRVRGVRRIERSVEAASEPQADVVLGYCAAVRSAITDDGRPPLGAPGLQRKERLEAVEGSLQRVAEKATMTFVSMPAIRQRPGGQVAPAARAHPWR